MEFFGIPLGRYFGINVRLDLTCLLFAAYEVRQFGDPFYGLLVVSAIYFCILLHEFGHALAARWCDGEAENILLWPLGGLAYVRPAFNPTAHLITTVAGPAVTLVIWLVLKPVALVMIGVGGAAYGVGIFLYQVAMFNKFILLFNLVPAFPMDGGRILRDGLWHWLDSETATRIAVNVSRFLALVAVGIILSPQSYWRELAAAGTVPDFLIVVPRYLAGDFFMLLFPLFVFLQSASEQRYMAMEARGAHDGFSIGERLRRGRKQRQFRQAVKANAGAAAETAFHKCAVCGVTEAQSPTMDFRVCPECSNGQEYCRDHLNAHTHR